MTNANNASVRHVWPTLRGSQGSLKAYSATKIVFNRSVKNDINMRVFEALASGSMLLTNDLSENGQSELFEEGHHLLTYRSDVEFFEKARFYMEHEQEREKIARQGLQCAQSRHTYRHRMESLLNHIENSGPSETVSVLEPALPPPVESSAEFKDPTYYEFARPEVLELIPQSATRVLDVGCGAGRLGAALKERQPAKVIGIECNPRAAVLARLVLDEVFEIDLADPNAEFPPGPFDAIVCADVLEHLPRPQLVLGRLRSLLAPEGSLVASLPNVQHHSVVRSLLAGNFTYEPAGLLDEDHKTFFTRREIEKLFERSGLGSHRLG